MDFRKAINMIKLRWCGIGSMKFVVELRFQYFAFWCVVSLYIFTIESRSIKSDCPTFSITICCLSTLESFAWPGRLQ